MAITYHQYISSTLWEGKRYGKGQFYSPLKDMKEQVYDKDGNQIGIAEKNSDGSRELTLLGVGS